MDVNNLQMSLISEALPEIPNKRYFTIGEASDLCGVKPHVLRYWEQEFSQLKPTKRRGNRRYYQHKDVEMVRLIRHLLYEKGFTITGARQHLTEMRSKHVKPKSPTPLPTAAVTSTTVIPQADTPEAIPMDIQAMVAELEGVLETLQ